MGRKEGQLHHGGEGKLDPVQTIAFFFAATVAGFAGYYVPLHFNALLSLLAYGISDAQLATVFVFCLTFSCLACSLFSTSRDCRGLAIAVAGGYVACALAIPLLFLAMPAMFSAARPFLWLVLLLLCAALVLRDENRKAAALVMAASGALGFLVLFFSLCDNALLALFTGFFGLSWDGRIRDEQGRPPLGLPVLLVPFVGMLLVMLPAATPFLAQPVLSAALPLAGAGQSAALVVGKALYDLCSAFAIGKARSQGSAMLSDAGADIQTVFLGIALGFVSLLCAIAFCRLAPRPGEKARKTFAAAGKAVLAGLVLLSCGPWGVVVATAAAAISGYAGKAGTHRGMCLGCLYVPAIIYPLGLAPLLAGIALGY